MPISEKVKSFRLRFFGHLARSAPEEDHHRVIAAALRPPPDWRRPPGRPRSIWLRVIDEDVQPQNFGVHTAWRKAKDTVRQRSVRSSPLRRRTLQILIKTAKFLQAFVASDNSVSQLFHCSAVNQSNNILCEYKSWIHTSNITLYAF